MKRKLLSLLLAFAVTLSVLPVGVLAEGENAGDVVSVGTADDLKNALADSADGNTAKIKLTADIECSEILSVSRNAEIDFAGRTLTLADDDKLYVKVGSGVTLTIRDTSATSGAITSKSKFATFVAMRGSTLNVENVTIENKLTTGGGGYGVMLNPSPADTSKLQTNVNLKNLSINAGAGGVYAHGNIQETDTGKYPVVNLENVTIVATADEGAGLYLAGMTKTTVTDCKITATQGLGIGIKAGTLTIKGTSKVRGEGAFHDSSANGNGINSDGSALLVENHSGYAGNIQISIEGSAELTSKNGYAVHEFTGGTSNSVPPKIEIMGGKFVSAKDTTVLIQEHTDSNKIITISGGTFNKQVAINYLKEGFSLTQGPDNSFTATPPEPETEAQIIKTRTKGPEDDDPNADYEKAYQTAGVELGAQAVDGSYTLTVDKARLKKVIEAGTATSPDTNSEYYKAYQVMENKNNRGKLWFGAEYPVPDGVTGIAKASISFDGGAFTDADLEDMTNPSGKKGLFNYIQVYDGSAIATEGETALIKWLDDNGNVLAKTKADIKIAFKSFTVTFDTNGGSKVEDQPVVSGEKATRPAADPSKDGYDFVGWFKKGEETSPFDFNTAITDNITLTAKWDRPEGQYTITFDKNCGDDTVTINPSSVLTVAGKLESGPIPKRTGYIFDGWYLNKDGSGSRVTFKTIFKNDDTVYAKWSKRGGVDIEEPSDEFTVTFDLQDGSEGMESVSVEKDKTVAKPENPTRDGYSFNGWYKDKECTEIWDFEKDTVTEDITIYAKWTKIPTPGDENYEYRIWIRYGSRHGDIYTSHWYAEKGETVTLTVYPDSDYQLEWLEISQESGGLVNWERDGREYTFTMPASNVTVDAGFDLRTVHYSSATDWTTSEPSKKPAVVPVFTPLDQRPATAMSDVAWGSWAYSSAQWAYQNGYLDMAYDGTFRLDDPVSHQQMWKIMAQWLGEPAATEREIASWACKIGAGKGSSPTGAMTRQDMVAYLYQCYFLMGGDVSTTGNLAAYADSRLIAPASQKAWLWAVEKGIVTGTAGGNLNPGKTLSRGEFAAMLMRLCQKLMG